MFEDEDNEDSMWNWGTGGYPLTPEQDALLCKVWVDNDLDKIPAEPPAVKAARAVMQEAATAYEQAKTSAAIFATAAALTQANRLMAVARAAAANVH